MSLAKIEDVENFEVSQTLPVITCDYESLKSWAQGITAKYQGLLVTEDQIPEIKKDMAELNKIKAKIERARIDTVKAVSAPIKDFEAQIKTVVEIFEDTYSALGNQIKEYENTAKEEKRDKIRGMIEERIAEAIAINLDMRDKIFVAINEKWLNKSVTMKTIGDEIADCIAKQITSEREAIRLEKAQAERRLLIEKAIDAINDKNSVSIPVSQFMVPRFTSLELPATSALLEIEKEAEAQIAKIKRKMESNQEDPEKTTKQAILAPKPDIEEEASPLMMFRFTVFFTQEQENQVREILNNNQFMRIKRQLESVGVKTTIEKGEVDG